MPFKLTVDGDSFIHYDLTLDEAIAVEKETETSWRFIDPLRSASHCKAMLRALLARTRPDDVVEKILGDLTLKTALACVEWVEEDLPTVYEDGIPKAEGATSTRS